MSRMWQHEAVSSEWRLQRVGRQYQSHPETPRRMKDILMARAATSDCWAHKVASTQLKLSTISTHAKDTREPSPGKQMD